MNLKEKFNKVTCWIKNNVLSKKSSASFNDHAAFFKAVESGNDAAAAAILEKHPDAIDWKKLKTDKHHSAIHFAAVLGHIKIVEMLLKYGTPVDQLNASGQNALNLAAMRGINDIVCLLIRAGADILNHGDIGEKAYAYVIDRCSTDAIEALFDANPIHRGILKFELGAKISIPSRKTIELIKFSVEKKIFDVNEHIHDGDTLLKAAAKCDDSETIKFLLQYGAQVSITDKAGYTAIHYLDDDAYLYHLLNNQLRKEVCRPALAEPLPIPPRIIPKK